MTPIPLRGINPTDRQPVPGRPVLIRYEIMPGDPAFGVDTVVGLTVRGFPGVTDPDPLRSTHPVVNATAFADGYTRPADADLLPGLYPLPAPIGVPAGVYMLNGLVLLNPQPAGIIPEVEPRQHTGEFRGRRVWAEWPPEEPEPAPYIADTYSP